MSDDKESIIDYEQEHSDACGRGERLNFTNEFTFEQEEPGTLCRIHLQVITNNDIEFNLKKDTRVKLEIKDDYLLMTEVLNEMV